MPTRKLRKNTHCAVNANLNSVVPGAYKITSTMAMIVQGHNYPANNNPCATLHTLRMRHNKGTPETLAPT